MDLFGCKCVQNGAACIHDLKSPFARGPLMAKTSAISVRLAEEVKAALERAASEDHRPLASYVEKLLLEHLRGAGYLAVKPLRASRVTGGAAYAKGMADSAIDRAMEGSAPSAKAKRERRRALTEMPGKAVVKQRRRKWPRAADRHAPSGG